MSERSTPLLNPPAWAAFGRNDIRGTYRDPLLVMLVLAPVIWTVGTVVLVPPLTTTLARRYAFDLVPYYPLVITGLLMLTSIIIVGGLGAFLVLDEIDAGTLAALRVTPVSLASFFAHRAATVVAVTTVYVVATMSFSGILQPGLVPALIPIGLVTGLSSVVTLLLIVAVASNNMRATHTTTWIQKILKQFSPAEPIAPNPYPRPYPQHTSAHPDNRPATACSPITHSPTYPHGTQQQHTPVRGPRGTAGSSGHTVSRQQDTAHGWHTLLHSTPAAQAGHPGTGAHQHRHTDRAAQHSH